MLLFIYLSALLCKQAGFPSSSENVFLLLLECTDRSASISYILLIGRCLHVKPISSTAFKKLQSECAFGPLIFALQET